MLSAPTKYPLKMHTHSQYTKKEKKKHTKHYEWHEPVEWLKYLWLTNGMPLIQEGCILHVNCIDTECSYIRRADEEGKSSEGWGRGGVVDSYGKGAYVEWRNMKIIAPAALMI